MAQALLELRDVEVRYGNHPVLKIPHLSVTSGEVLAITGPNGAGKSTLIRALGLLEQPEHGEAYFDGTRVTGKNALLLRREIATVFQEPLLLNATVYENVALGLRLRGLDRRSIERSVRPWLERFEISHLTQRQARSLSGGEAQRTSLARAFAVGPKLLLLDEPFSALDPPTREVLLLELQTILRETVTTTVFVTHDRNEAWMLADRIGVLLRGEMQQLGSPMQIFSQPVREDVAEFVGVETRITAVVESVADGLAYARFNGGGIEIGAELNLGAKVLLCLRPEDISLSRYGGETLQSNGLNQCSGRVIKITPWGLYYRVVVDCAGSLLIAFVSRPSFIELELHEGADVLVGFKTAAVHVIRKS
jgi:tungstate transport system ATP-binding protein